MLDFYNFRGLISVIKSNTICLRALFNNMIEVTE